ncbi:MAG: 60S ribosomal protein L26 [Candidatus Bathyarchaeia archaeon]
MFVEGITRESVSGEAKNVPIHASKVMITSLDLSDKWRAEALEARARASA